MITKEFKLTKKSQVTIPETVKETLGIRAGDAVIFDVAKDVECSLWPDISEFCLIQSF